MMENKKAKPQRLTQEQYFLAREWAKKNANDLRDARPTFAKVAAQMTADLGFPVSDASARRVIHDSGITWQPRFTRRNGSRQKDRTAVLARHIVELLRDLGKTIPEDLQAIARRHETPIKGGVAASNSNEPVPSQPGNGATNGNGNGAVYGGRFA